MSLLIAQTRRRRLLRTIGVRLASLLAVLFGAVTVTFVALQLMPGDIATIVSGTTQTTPAVRAQIVHQYQLNDPLLVQYLHYLDRLLDGDLGQSYILRVPVSTAIGEQLPATLELLVATLVIIVVLSFAIATLSAHRRPWLTSTLALSESIVVATPAFWLGIVALVVFSFRLHWFPAVGSGSFDSLVLPSLTLAAAPSAVVTQVLRDGLEQTLDEPFVVTARARGLSEARVRIVHAARHALLPVVTLVGWVTASLLSGAVVVETVFSRRGVGRLALNAVLDKDVPVVLAVVLIAALVYNVINALVDILYTFIDPRTARD